MTAAGEIGFGIIGSGYMAHTYAESLTRHNRSARMEAFVLLTQDFIDALRKGRQPTVSGEDGRAAVAMIEACYRSVETGQAVDL